MSTTSITLTGKSHAAADLGQRPALEPHRAAHHRHEAERRLQERALARTVGADHAEQAGLLDREIHVPEHGPAAVGHGDVVKLEQRRGHG
jgi:hypothetical protein